MNSENQLWSSPNLEEEEDDDDEDEGSVKSIEWGGFSWIRRLSKLIDGCFNYSNSCR